MFPETCDWARLFFQALAGIVLLAGATLDLHIGLLVQTGRLIPGLRGLDVLAGRRFTLLHAKLALLFTLFFALPGLLQKPAAGAPQDASLITGTLLYAFTGLAVAALCLAYPGMSLHDAFLSPRTRARDAVGKGVLYGLAAIPPVMLLSMAVTSVAQQLGYAPRTQDVFEWLKDGDLSLGTRLFMLLAAVVVAPVVEELVFRGILFTSALRGRSFLSAALLTGAYFSLAHFHAPSFLPLLLLSLAFSAGYAATGSILTPITMHALFNLTSVLFFLADGV